jgi:hypothetical protein
VIRLFFLFILSALSAKSTDPSTEWELFGGTSYTYWLAGENGLELGRTGDFVAGDDPLFFPIPVTVISHAFEYASGFQLETGVENREWAIWGHYTWVRNRSSQTVAAPSAAPFLGAGVILTAPWFLQTADDGGTLSGTSVSSTWHLSMDIADFSLGHMFYQANRWKATVFGGLRALWIRQKMIVALNMADAILLGQVANPIQSNNYAQSWALGPRFGLKGSFLLGAGFCLTGNIGSSLLYTDYIRITHSEDSASAGAFPNKLELNMNTTTLKPAMETGLGICWNRRFSKDRYLFNIGADYDFLLFWSQNMMREMLDITWAKAAGNGDLYLHGLTLTAALSF